MGATCVVVLVCFVIVTTVVTQSIFSFYSRQECVTELRVDRDSAAHDRASADSRGDRVVDLIIIQSIEGQTLDPGLVTELQIASDEVQRKEEVLDRRNKEYADYNDRCNITPATIAR